MSWLSPNDRDLVAFRQFDPRLVAAAFRRMPSVDGSIFPHYMGIDWGAGPSVSVPVTVPISEPEPPREPMIRVEYNARCDAVDLVVDLWHQQPSAKIQVTIPRKEVARIVEDLGEMGIRSAKAGEAEAKKHSDLVKAKDEDIRDLTAKVAELRKLVAHLTP